LRSALALLCALSLGCGKGAAERRLPLDVSCTCSGVEAAAARAWPPGVKEASRIACREDRIAGGQTSSARDRRHVSMGVRRLQARSKARSLSRESAPAGERSPKPPAGDGSSDRIHRRVTREETSASSEEHSSVASRADECLATNAVVRVRHGRRDRDGHGAPVRAGQCRVAVLDASASKPRGTRAAPIGEALSGDAIGASRPQRARCKRRRRPRTAWTERCCSPRWGSTPSSGCVASGAGGDSREVPALRASPSAGVAPIRARPSRPSPDRDWMLSRTGESHDQERQTF
jgi:hypothetical protein